MTQRQLHPYIDLKITFGEETDRDIWHDVAVFSLSEIGFDVFFDDEDGALHAYIEKGAFDEQTAVNALEALGSVASYSFAEIEDRNWNEEWEKNYHRPVETVSGRVVVRASFHESRPDVPYDIVIDPKMAFGTGNHATTAGMLQLLDSLDLTGKTVIDMGCGSGVLGIFAMKKGAAECTSIDIDDRSTDNTAENARVNGVSLDIRLGDATVLDGIPKADLFLANITRNIILTDLDKYLGSLVAGGTLLLSGFLRADLPVISEALGQRGFGIKETLNPEGDWLAVRAERNDDLH